MGNEYGILIGEKYLRNTDALKKIPLYHELSVYFRSHGDNIYFFSPQRINFNKHAVERALNADFKEKNIELPTIIWRTFMKYFQKKENMASFNRAYSNKTIFTPNSWKFKFILRDKYLTYTYLRFDDLISDVIPKTFLLSSLKPDRITELRKKRSYLLKPRNGMAGLGIKLLHEINAEEFGFYAEAPNDYIVQEFINSKKVKGKTIDIRVFLFNTGSRFEPIFMFTRIAKKNEFRTNLHMGGTVLFGKEMDKLMDQKLQQILCKKASVIADKLSEDFYGNICTVDFMLDNDDKPWFIEANSDPGWKFMKKINAQSKELIFDKLLKLFKKMDLNFRNKTNRKLLP